MLNDRHRFHFAFELRTVYINLGLNFISVDQVYQLMEQLRRGQNEKGKRWQEKQAPQTIEIIDIECGLLSRVSQKIVATKRRIFQGKISSPQDILCKSKRHSISNNSMPQTHQPGTGKSAHGASQTTGREEEEPGYPGDGCGVHQRAWC